MEANWVERRCLRSFRYRKRSRTVTVRAEDAYLRVDVACGLEDCPCCPPTAPAVPRGTLHLLLPDADALSTFLEIFELPDVHGLIVLTSVTRQAEVRQGLDLLAAAEWYDAHLGCRLPIVILSDQLAARFGTETQAAASGGERQAAAGGDAQQQHGGGGASDEDEELEALLRQMDVGGSGGAAAAGLGSLLEGLSLGGAGGAGAALAAAAATGGGGSAAAPGGGPLGPGVHTLSAAQYFAAGGVGGSSAAGTASAAGLFAHPTAVLDIYDSIAQSLAEQEEAAAAAAGAGAAAGAAAAGAGSAPHLGAAAVEAGLRGGTLLQGTLAVSRRNPQEATVRIGGGELGGAGRQVLVSGRTALNRAVHGDSVAVRLLPREQWRPLAIAAEAAPGEDEGDLLAAAAGGDGAETAADEAAEPGAATAAAGSEAELDPVAQLFAGASADALLPCGEVVGVLQRSGAEVVACLAEEDERALSSRQESSRQESVLCVPVDRRLPKLRLRSRQLHRLLGQRLVLRLDGWERGSSYPHGHLVRVLGPLNDLRRDWGLHLAIPDAELASRRDLRGPDIDPPGCTDVDDALSVRWLGAGAGGAGGGGKEHVEVGVHIADVSFFVRQVSIWASFLFLALLSEDMCSLRGGVDRYAVSVLWTLDAEMLEVQSAWFGRTLIRSRYQLEYSQAQGILDGTAAPPPPGAPDVPAADRPTLQRCLAFLARLAVHRRQLRLDAGALELESAELRFRTDAAGQPTDVLELPMMKIVAEMMIFANAAVAERVAASFPRAALLRRHPPPRREAFEEVAELCGALLPPDQGLDLLGGPAALAASLARACAAAPPALASLIKSLAMRAMSEAEYFSTGEGCMERRMHAAATPMRYADVVVHRQLLAAVEAGGHEAAPASAPAPIQPPLSSAELSSRAAVMNDRHRTAKRAQKDCSDLYLLLLLHAKPHVKAATVFGFRGTALLVFVPRYHLRGVIHLTDKEGVCRPPLRAPGEADAADPFVLSYRRGLEVESREGGLVVRERQSGAVVVASFAIKQRVWVELGADGSRAHGPTLRMRLLADSHPAAREAAAREAAAEAPGQAPARAAPGADQGCGALPRGAPRAYRPPGIGSRAAQQQQQQQQQAAAAGAAGEQQRPPGGAGAAALPGQAGRHPVQQQRRPREGPPPAASIAQALEAALREVADTNGQHGVPAPEQENTSQQQQQQQQQQQALEPAGSSAVAAGAPAAGAPALLALACLQQRASRTAVRSAGAAPGGLRARERAARASRCRQHLDELRRQLLVAEVEHAAAAAAR
eukprot:scaffold7.g3744.t1